jgi:hypothetical protein
MNFSSIVYLEAMGFILCGHVVMATLYTTKIVNS